MLPPRDTFPISNLIPGLRFGFFKNMFFPKIMESFFRVLFLVLFSLSKIK